VVGGFVDFNSYALARYVNPDALFVNAIYQQLLGRPAESAGLVNWLGWLRQGASRAQFVQAVEQSQEYRIRLVDSYYLSLLGRPADPAGEAGFVNALASGMSV